MWRILLAESIGTFIAWPCLTLALYFAGLPMPRTILIAGLVLVALNCALFDWRNVRK